MDEWETVSTVLDWQWYSLFCSAASVTHIIASIAHHLLQVLLQVALQLAERSPEQKNMTGRRVEVCLSVTSETKVTGMILKTATTATAPTCCLARKSGTSFVWEVYAWGQNMTNSLQLQFSLFRCGTLEKTHKHIPNEMKTACLRLHFSQGSLQTLMPAVLKAAIKVYRGWWASCLLII